MEKRFILEAIQSIVNLLSRRQYSDLAGLDFGKRLTAQEVEQAIANYGGVVTMPLDNNFDNVHIYERNDLSEVAVDYDLWINNQRSDLTLSVFLKEIDGRVRFCIENIHVL